MNRCEMEQRISNAIALLELVSLHVTTGLEESDNPSAGCQIMGIYALTDSATNDLLAVIQALPHLTCSLYEEGQP